MALYPNVPFTDGDPFTADLAYLAFNQVWDDRPEYLGHHARITDDQLSGNSGQLKARFTAIEEELRVTHVSGLLVRYNAGQVVLPDGTYYSIPAGQLTIPDSTTSYIYVTPTGIVECSLNPPVLLFRMAKVFSTSGIVSAITDLRYPSFKQILPQASSIKVFGGSNLTDKTCSANEVFDEGLYYFRDFTVPAGVSVTIQKWARFYCSGKVTIAGTVMVAPFSHGAPGFVTTVTGYGAIGGLMGSGAGAGGVRAMELGQSISYAYGAQPYGSGGGCGFAQGSPAGTTSPTGLVALAAGGSGGGGLWIEAARAIVVSGTITASGQQGYFGTVNSGYAHVSGGGGGSGGLVLLSSLVSVRVAVGATIDVRGGNGGAGVSTRAGGDSNGAMGGGGGGGGYVVYIAPDINATGANILLSGGSKGTDAGTFLGGGFGGGFGGDGGRQLAGAPGRQIIRPFVPIGS